MNALRTYLEAERGRKAELARHLAVTPDYITKWLNGRLHITPSIAAAISVHTGLAIVDLLYPDGLPVGAVLVH